MEAEPLHALPNGESVEKVGYPEVMYVKDCPPPDESNKNDDGDENE